MRQQKQRPIRNRCAKTQSYSSHNTINHYGNTHAQPIKQPNNKETPRKTYFTKTLKICGTKTYAFTVNTAHRNHLCEKIDRTIHIRAKKTLWEHTNRITNKQNQQKPRKPITNKQNQYHNTQRNI